MMKKKKNIKKITAICPVCKNTFSRFQSQLKGISSPTCSYACLAVSRKTTMLGNKNPHWKGGKPKFTGNRFLVYAKGHPGAKLCKGTYILEYRLLAEKKIGRYLRNDEVVHHINGDSSDNSLDNLSVMTQAEHAKIHTTERHKIAPGKHFRDIH